MRSKDGCNDCLASLQGTRRSFVKAGILGTFGFSLSELLRHEARAAVPVFEWKIRARERR